MSGQKIGWRPYTAPSTNTVSTLLTSLYGAWNGDTTGTSLDASIFGAWNAEATSTVTTLNGSVSSAWNGDNFYSTSGITASNVNNVTLSTGKIGNAFTFNGSNYVSLPASVMNFTGDFTVNFWIKINSTAVSNQGIMGNKRWSLGPGGFQIIFNGGWLQALAGNGVNGTSGFLINAPNNYITNFTTWTMVTFIHRKGVSNSFYINAGTTSTVAHQHTLESSIFNGQLGSEPMDNYRLNGNLDAVTFWDRAITQNEIYALYNSTNGREYPYPSTISVDIPSPNDAVGTNHGSLMNGVAFSTGKVGNAFTFDGVNDYVSFPTNSWNSLVGTDLTISLWVKFASTANQTLISNMSSPSINVWSGWEIRLDGGRPTIYMWNNSGTGVGAQGAVVSTNTWYHIVATRKKGSRTRIYINGVLAQTDTNTPDPSINGTYYPNIGHLQYSSSYHGLYMTNGSLIDSVNLWSKEISADEVTQLYNSGTGAQYPYSSQTLPSTNNQLGIDNATLVNGCTFGDGKIGKAFTFDGVNDYVQLPNNSLNLVNNYSINLWLYLTSSQSTTLLSVFGNDGFNKGFYIDITSLSSYTFRFVGFNNNSNVIALNGTGNLGYLNRWSMATLTVSGTSVKIYLDGTLASSGEMSVPINYTSTTYPTLGAFRNGSGTPNSHLSNGTKIDGLSVWLKELTQAEVTELYNSGNGKQITATPIVTNGLVLNLDASRTSSYPGSGTTWTDISGSGNNGTMVNGPVFGTASGGQITFDGINDYVQMSNALTLGTNQFTIEFWINNKYNYTSGNLKNTILSNYLDYASSWNTYLYIGIYYGTNGGDFGSFNSNGDIYLINSIGNFIMNSSNTGKINITNNQWTHVCFVRNGNDVSTYKNGIKLATINNVSTANNNYSGSRSFKIGGGVSNTQNHFGDLSNNRIYNTALTDAEVLQNFNATKSRFGL